MRSIIVQSRFARVKYVVLCIMFITIQFLVLQSISKNDEINVLQQHQRVVVNKMNNIRDELDITARKLEEGQNLSNDEKVQLHQVEEKLNESLQLYSNLNRFLQKASVQLNFYDEYNEDYLDAKINYLLLLLENIPSTDDVYEQLSSENYMDLWYEVVELNMLLDNEQTHHLFEIHQYNRIYLNYIAHGLVFLFLVNFIFEMNFITLKKTGWTSFIPKTFKESFIEHYGGMIKRFIIMFLLSMSSFFVFLFYKGLGLNFNTHAVQKTINGNVELYNFFLLTGVIVLGWLLMITMSCLIKDMLSLWLNESIISSLVAIICAGFIFMFLSNFNMGINVKFISLNHFYFSYGFSLPLLNIFAGFGIVSLINICLFFALKQAYNKAYLFN